MALVNYSSVTLRASAATSGASEQDAAVTLPESVSDLWAVAEKTAEANADNLLTVRIQCKVGSIWVDVAWDALHTTGALATAADTAANVTRTPNIIDGVSTAPTFRELVQYKDLPSNVVRVASVSSGTGVANTFSVIAYYRNNP